MFLLVVSHFILVSPHSWFPLNFKTQSKTKYIKDKQKNKKQNKKQLGEGRGKGLDTQMKERGHQNQLLKMLWVWKQKENNKNNKKSIHCSFAGQNNHIREKRMKRKTLLEKQRSRMP